MLDLLDQATVLTAFDEVRPDLVINAAAYTAVDKAEAEPDAATALNVDAVARLGELCASRGVPLIHISTDYVFDGEKPAPYLEDDPVAPTGVYGQTKLDGERALAAVLKEHVILRTAWVHSPFANNFVKTMLRLAETRDELGVVDDQIGSPTYAPHLAQAIAQIASHILNRQETQSGAPAWGTYHAAGSGQTTWCGMARKVFEEARARGMPGAQVKAITTADYPTPAMRPANSQLDCSKLERNFGLRLPDWQEGVALCVARLTSS
jgi:dTDP-4-dehydrorhamnose reductase